MKMNRIHSQQRRMTPVEATQTDALYRESALFGLKNQLRQAVLQSWAAISKLTAASSSSKVTENNLSRFIEYVL